MPFHIRLQLLQDLTIILLNAALFMSCLLRFLRTSAEVSCMFFENKSKIYSWMSSVRVLIDFFVVMKQDFPEKQRL